MMKQEIKFDDVVELLGGFGKYQKRLYLIVVAPALWCAIMTIITVFTVGEQEHRCKIPYLDNDTYNNKELGKYINHTGISTDDLTCKVIVNTTLNSTEPCTSWVYDKSVFTSTLVSEFDLICSRTILQSHASTGIFVGALFGAIFMGTLGDTFGRKIATCLSLSLMFMGHLGTGLVQNYHSFIIMRVIGGIGNIGYWNSAMILGFEMAGPTKRVWTGILIEVVWCLGEYITVFVAYFVRDWRTLQLIFGASVGIFLIYWKLLTESPRWLINKGKRQAALKILSNVAKVNNKELPSELELHKDEEPKGAFIFTIKQIVLSKVMLIRTIILLLNWLTVNAGYYGLTLNSGKIGGSVYVNFTISVTMEMIAYIICLVFLDKIGRRTLHCSCMIIGGISCLSSIFPVIYGNESHRWITITLSMIGKLGISAAFADIYFLSAELYPTTIRSFIIGISCIIGKLGSLAAPYIADLGLLIKSSFGKALPLLVFGSLMLICGFLALLLPETLNRKMPETIEDAIALKRNRGTANENTEVCMELTKEHLST